MNKVYKVIYNKKKGLYEVVSEIAGGFTRAASLRHRISKSAALTLAILAGLSWASPLPVAQAVTLEQQVAANTTNIATNTTNIASNKTDINTNKSNIATNTTNINTNKTNIASNKTAIETNKTNIETNKTNIEKKADKTDLNQEKTDRTNADANLQSQIDTNKTNIETNKNDIAANKADIATNKSDIADNKSNIAKNKTSIDNLKSSLGYTTDGSGNLVAPGNVKYVKVKGSSTDKEAQAAADESIAIGPNAKANNGAEQSIAIGDGAETKGTSKRGIAIGQGAITGTTPDMGADEGSDGASNIGGVDSIAVGTKSSARGNGAIAIGKNAMVQNIPASGGGTDASTDSMAIGTGAIVYASNNALAIGSGAVVNRGASNGVNANEALAIGYNASVERNAIRSISIGSGAKTTNTLAIALGYNASSEKQSIAIGTTSKAGTKAMAIGESASGKAEDSIAIGNAAASNSIGDISIGKSAGVYSNQKRADVDGNLIAIGVEAGKGVIGSNNVAVGSKAGQNVHSNYNVAIGSEAGQGFKTEGADINPQNGYNVSIGYQANDYSEYGSIPSIQYATAIGANSKAVSDATAIGRNAKAYGTYSMAFGENAVAGIEGNTTDSSHSIAFGYNTIAKYGNIAIGAGSSAVETPQGKSYLTELTAPMTYISVGTADNLRRISNVADGSADSDAVTVRQLKLLKDTIQTSGSGTSGGVSQSYVDTKFASLEEGIQNLSKKYFSVSTNENTGSGNKDNTGASANNKNAMAIGPDASAQGDDSLAVGNNVKATGQGSVAIGAKGPLKSGEASDTLHQTEANGDRSVSIGSGSLAQTTDSIAIGTRATNYNQVNQDPTKQGIKSIAIGYYAETAGDNAIAGGTTAMAAGNGSIALGNKTSAKSGAVDSIAIGSNAMIEGANSIAVGEGNQVHTGTTYVVGTDNTAGEGTKSHLSDSGIFGKGNNIKAINNDKTNAVGKLNDIYMTGNSNTIDQVNDGFSISKVNISGSGNTVSGSSVNAMAGTLSGVTIQGYNNTVKGRNTNAGVKDLGNITVVGNDNTVDASEVNKKSQFSDIQILGSHVNATVGNSAYIGSKSSAKAAADDTTAGVGAYEGEHYYLNGSSTAATFAGSTASGVVTVGSADKNHPIYRRIQNVAAGKIGKDSTDAVNGSQLYYATRAHHFRGDNYDASVSNTQVDVGSDGYMNIIGGESADNLTDNNIGVISTNSNKTMTVKLSKDLKNLHSVNTENTTTTNLTVNHGGNVDMGGNQIHNVAAGTANTDAVNVSQLKDAISVSLGDIYGKMGSLNNRISHAGANAAALAGLHPVDFDPDDKWDFAGGYGNYAGANAVAIGAFYRPTEDVMLSVGGSMGGGENMVNAGVTFKLGQKNHVSTSRVAMAKEIRDMRKVMAQQSAEIERLKNIHGMAIDPEKSALFPDVAENHWAYEYITKLAGNGILEGYPDGEFKGDRMMSRYEFATMVYRIVQKGMNANDPELSNMVKEFSPELKYIRIDVIRHDRHGKPTIERVRVNEGVE